jgi:hypothetical protein
MGQPNQALESTPSSLRFAPAFRRGSPLAFDFQNRNLQLMHTQEERPKSRSAVMAALSDEILADLELDRLPFERILSKCIRLARLRNDFEAVKWFSLELNGYQEDKLPHGIQAHELFSFALRSARTLIVQDKTSEEKEHKYWVASIPELEAEILVQQEHLKSLRPPESFQPAVSRHSFESIYTGPTSNEYVVEKYSDILLTLNQQKSAAIQQIKWAAGLLSKIRVNVYHYVLNTNLQLKFENITESIFQETKEAVDKRLGEINPEIMKKFVASYERLRSDNPEEWSQAMSSCRNILKVFADFVFPAQKDRYTKRSGEKLVVTDDKYKNRLLAFIDSQLSGDKAVWLESRLSDLERRVHVLNDLLSRGTHVGLSRTDVRMCVLDTYLLIGSLLSFTTLEGDTEPVGLSNKGMEQRH